MADSKSPCPRTQAAYEKAQPIIAKLPPELAQKVVIVATNVCVAEQSAAALAGIAQFATGAARSR